MNSELVSSYLKWGQKKNRNLLMVVLSVAMLASLSLHGYSFYQQLASQPEMPNDSQTGPALADNKPLTVKDFELLFGFSNKAEAQKQGADIPKTRLNLTLRGALGELGSRTDEASAIIQSSSQDKLYGIGDTLPGGATLKEIHSDHVVLNRGGQLETLSFPEAAKDSRALQEYRNPVESSAPKAEKPGFTQEPDGKSLEQRMQELRDKLQGANQGI
ncbi:hypothetical protein EOPP23_16740 [Endozoicomonas sp. OPT23]|uniref:type II secretion system protein N n=1 Tax=Endozoicomonas sp. OPT23 TaxID=2072845 RepID=UPI00129BD80A|nr:type II secretion system protein N [Endozoicomonas sp. OPT23]MRI34632.1 hypothetical protein [Endozoicomonas sp. OPT23]